MLASELFWIAFGSIAAAVGSLATAVSLIFAAKALSYAGRQMQESRKVAEESKKITRGEFLLRLEEFFSQHIETHMRLRPGGEWSDGVTGPKNASEWGPVERYMGLFERIQVLIDDGIIDLATIDKLYGYRVFNIVENDVIRKTKLEGARAEYWQGFIKLWQGLKEQRRKKELGGTTKSAT